jgi:hypothetical protein
MHGQPPMAMSTPSPCSNPGAHFCPVCRQWLFLVESLPSLVIGGVIWCWLPSHPLTAWMLTPSQRELVHRKVTGNECVGEQDCSIRAEA